MDQLYENGTHLPLDLIFFVLQIIKWDLKIFLYIENLRIPEFSLNLCHPGSVIWVFAGVISLIAFLCSKLYVCLCMYVCM